MHEAVKGWGMNEQALRAVVARFLKEVSDTAQSEIEKAVRNALASGKLKSHDSFTIAAALSSEKAGLNVTVYNTIAL